MGIIAVFRPFSRLPRIPVEMTNREYGLIGGLAGLWGVSFFFSKVALAELPPFTLVLGRFGIAALAGIWAGTTWRSWRSWARPSPTPSPAAMAGASARCRRSARWSWASR